MISTVDLQPPQVLSVGKWRKEDRPETSYRQGGGQLPMGPRALASVVLAAAAAAVPA